MRNLSIIDHCIACGHYHYPSDRKRDAGKCVNYRADECSCQPREFVGRNFKHKM